VAGRTKQDIYREIGESDGWGDSAVGEQLRHPCATSRRWRGWGGERVRLLAAAGKGQGLVIKDARLAAAPE
jgi:hypothetical protein